MSIVKKLVALLVLTLTFHALNVDAGDKVSLPFSRLGMESNPQNGQLILKDIESKKRIFTGTNFSREQLMAIYHKFSLGRSLSELGKRARTQVSVEIDEDLLKQTANPHLGFMVKTNQSPEGLIDLPGHHIIPWIQNNGELGVGTIKVDKEVIFARPIIGDAEKEDFLNFVNGVNQARGSGGPTIKFDINKFNASPDSYWEVFQGIHKAN